MAALTRGLEAEKYDRAYSDRELIGRIVSYFVPHKWKVAIVSLAIFLMAGFGALVPIVIADSLNANAEGSLSNRDKWFGSQWPRLARKDRQPIIASSSRVPVLGGWIKFAAFLVGDHKSSSSVLLLLKDFDKTHYC